MYILSNKDKWTIKNEIFFCSRMGNVTMYQHRSFFWEGRESFQGLPVLEMFYEIYLLMWVSFFNVFPFLMEMAFHWPWVKLRFKIYYCYWYLYFLTYIYRKLLICIKEWKCFYKFYDYLLNRFRFWPETTVLKLTWWKD